MENGTLRSVQNNGKIKTEGGTVVLTAAQLDGVVGSVVNTGHIEAGDVRFVGRGNKVDVSNTGRVSVASANGQGGTVRMDTDGDLAVSGSNDATGSTKGGNVTLTASNINVKKGADINASGKRGGGTVLVGGNRQRKGKERRAQITTIAQARSSDRRHVQPTMPSATPAEIKRLHVTKTGLAKSLSNKSQSQVATANELLQRDPSAMSTERIRATT